MLSSVARSGQALAFKPFVKGVFINVNPPTDFNQDSIKTIAVCMVYPPPDCAFSHKWRFFRQLLYGPKVCVFDQYFLHLGIEKKQKRKIGRM